MINAHLGQYWETIVDTMMDGVIVVDGDCTILTSNRALEEMTGYDKKALAGQPCTILGCDVCVSGKLNSKGKKKS